MSTAVTSLRIRELLPLGVGGMGTAYLACSTAGPLERLVVVKRLHEHLVNDPDACQRLLEEAELAGYVHHANVVGVQHVGRDERGPFLVLDYVDGASLGNLAVAASPMRIPEAILLRVFLDCLAGLSAIHGTKDNRKRPLNILHRDVTPENILVGFDGVARLGDFGIAKSSRSAVKTAPLQLIGKLPYMAPEYIDQGEIGPGIDVYALGVSLWGLLAGCLPWEGSDQAQLLVKILMDGVPPLPESVHVSEELRAIVSKACALKPEDRYPSARAVAQAIEELELTQQVATHARVADYVVDAMGHEADSLRQEASLRLEFPSLQPTRAQAGTDAHPPSLPSLRMVSPAPPTVLSRQVGSPRSAHREDGPPATESRVPAPFTVNAPRPKSHPNLRPPLPLVLWGSAALLLGFFLVLGVGLRAGAIAASPEHSVGATRAPPLPVLTPEPSAESINASTIPHVSKDAGERAFASNEPSVPSSPPSLARRAQRREPHKSSAIRPTSTNQPSSPASSEPQPPAIVTRNPYRVTPPP